MGQAGEKRIQQLWRTEKHVLSEASLFSHHSKNIAVSYIRKWCLGSFGFFHQLTFNLLLQLFITIYGLSHNWLPQVHNCCFTVLFRIGPWTVKWFDSFGCGALKQKGNPSICELFGGWKRSPTVEAILRHLRCTKPISTGAGFLPTKAGLWKM